MELPDIITPEFVAYLRAHYELPWDGLHGYAHWVRVCENGLYLARLNGANQQVVALFAFTHDMARRGEGHDHDHGRRAAERIRRDLQGRFFVLTAPELAQLVEAVTLHTDGLVQADLTVQTCWDADRLDLGRAGYHPDPRRLCTPQAKDPDTIAWAYERSIY